MTSRPFATRAGAHLPGTETVAPLADPAGGGSAPIRGFHRSMPGYAATPLVAAPNLADRWGVASVHVKDESARMGLPAFKILGASWAVNRVVSDRLGCPPCATLTELADVAAGSGIRLVTATDGNHGRALAHMANLLGLGARIYVPGGLPAATLDAIRSEGAEVIDTGNGYDAAVRIAADSVTPADALVQDTAWHGYQEVPGWVVDGYATMFAEIDEQSAGAATVVAVPTGVGSLLQAALQHFWRTDTRVLAVEPIGAACVTASLGAGRPIVVDTTAPTTMAGLNCGTVSRLAWPWIASRLDAAVGVADDESCWAAGVLHDAGVSAGPCGAAAAAGVEAVLRLPGGRAALGLGDSADGSGRGARVVLLSTEGAGDISGIGAAHG